MTLDDLVTVLQGYQRLGYGARFVTQYASEQLDPTNTVEITGVFAGDDEDEVVLETVTWHHVEDPQHDQTR